MAEIADMSQEQLVALARAQQQQLAEQAALATSAAVASSSSGARMVPSLIRGDRVPKFSGLPEESLRNWLHKTELIIIESGETRPDKIIASVAQGLQDSAYSWFSSARESGQLDSSSSWVDFKALLVQRFAPIDEMQLALGALLDITSGQAGSSVTSVEAFVGAFRANANVCRIHFSEVALVAILQRSMPPVIKTQMAIAPSTTLADATGKVMRLARTLALEGLPLNGSTMASMAGGGNGYGLQLAPQPPTYSTFPTAHAALANGPAPMDINVMHGQHLRGPKLAPDQCGYCKKVGHWARDRETKEPTCPLLIKHEAEKAAVMGTG